MQGLCSEQLSVEQTILPGCLYATCLLQLMLIGPLDEVRREHPTVPLAVCVDDLSLQRSGGARRVVDELAAA
eukprot:9387237-Pyramimonas_sp.AAC.1